MSRTSAIRDAWRPLTKQDREAVLLELGEVLGSPHFTNSKRYPALLQYVVEKTLAGESDLLKERTLGVEVFDRPASYDTNADTVVRYTAGEVRKRLTLYYHELGRKPLIQISLPPGSYIPEFLHAEEEVEARPEEPLGDLPEKDRALPGPDLELLAPSPQPLASPAGARTPAGTRRRWLAIAAMMLIATLAGLVPVYRSARASTALDEFWAPVLHGQRAILVCTGGTTIVPNDTVGFATANKSTEYPYVSIQIAASIAQLSSMLEQRGATTELRASATTQLSDLRERPVILLGGYNNDWTLRLLQAARFQFAGRPDVAIVDRTHPANRWERDHSLPYAAADDYALVARYRDPTTDGWVIALAGVGRNGTEAAAEFATSPHYLQLLKDRTGGDFANRNVEAILRISVIDGKTGAPSIISSYTW